MQRLNSVTRLSIVFLSQEKNLQLVRWIVQRLHCLDKLRNYGCLAIERTENRIPWPVSIGQCMHNLIIDLFSSRVAECPYGQNEVQEEVAQVEYGDYSNSCHECLHSEEDQSQYQHEHDHTQEKSLPGHYCLECREGLAEGSED